MSDEPRKAVYATDPKTWPVVECEPIDVYLDEFVHDCTPNLTDEQKSWPVVDCEPTDVFLDPVLVVELTVRMEADSGEVALGMAELLRVLSAREEELGGGGLVYDGRQSSREGNKVRIALYPKTEAGAKKRLQQLADLIEGAAALALPSEVVGAGATFVECHAVTTLKA